MIFFHLLSFLLMLPIPPLASVAILCNSVTVIIIAMNNLFLQPYRVVEELNRKSGKKIKAKKVQEEVKFTFHERVTPTKVRIIRTCDNDLSVIHAWVHVHNS